MKNKSFALALFCALLACGAFAQSGKNSRVAVIGGGSVDGSSQVTEKLLEECIVSLPSLKELEADVTARTEYLKEINGDPGKNDHVKVYTATVQISYKVRQKVLTIVTQNSLEAQKPLTREDERIVMKMSKPFESDAGEGDIFAGRSNRRYYYSTPEAAASNAKKRAEIWVGQQQNVLCSVGK
jgi:hypothetical protein